MSSERFVRRLKPTRLAAIEWLVGEICRVAEKMPLQVQTDAAKATAASAIGASFPVSFADKGCDEGAVFRSRPDRRFQCRLWRQALFRSYRHAARARQCCVSKGRKLNVGKVRTAFIGTSCGE
jgi:hypothetical protein